MVKDRQDLRYRQLLERSDAPHGDIEREALFYILSGNEELYSKINLLYDFNENIIKVAVLDEDVDLSSSARNLLKLGFNLYNGYEASVVDVFNGLDEDNARLAIEAIKIRFDI